MQKGVDWRVYLTVLRALIGQWMMVLSCLLVLQPHWMTLIKSMQQPRTDNDSTEKRLISHGIQYKMII